MNLTITLDNLDEAIRKLDELSNQIREYPVHVAQDMANQMYPSVMVDSKDGENTIIAPKEVAFEEFGTGFHAQNFDYGDIHTYPGSWSETHAQTFQHWVKSGKDPEKYRYNRNPSRKMQTAIERAEETALNRARSDFDF